MTPAEHHPNHRTAPDGSVTRSVGQDRFDWQLIDRYLAGVCDAEEGERARAMLQSSVAGEAVLSQFVQALGSYEGSPSESDKAHLRAQLRTEIADMRRLHPPSAVQVARGHHRAQTSTVGAYIAGHRARSKWIGAAFAIAACAVLALGIYTTNNFTSHVGNAVSQSSQRIYTTNRGERVTIQLADGSTVMLGAQSKLRYGYPFGGSDRSVYLEGEAYFTVSHHTSTPFVVYTAHSATRVLGTKFLVKAYPDDRDVQVVVADGKVALRSRDAETGSGTTLVNGDLAEIDANGLMTVNRDVAVDPYLGWTQGHLVLRHVTLGQAIKDLERWYDITIKLSDPTLANASLSVVLDVESVDQAMNMLAEVLNASWTRSGGVITLSPLHPTHPAHHFTHTDP